ncbi:MAG: UpxY family transcription antiterminator [Desulfobacterales bacterium]|nr:UpxY family transcription antiterminator [Desulfobacterales bacterium]
MTLPIEKNPKQLSSENILFETVNDAIWWVAHTKSRREKALADFFAEKHIGYYLPLIKMRQPSNRRERYSLLPLFAGYIFFKGNLQDRHNVYASNSIAYILEVNDQEKLCQELRQIYKVLAINDPIYPYDFLSEGQLVRIKNGPLQGIEGIIDRKDGNYRIVLSVSTIAKSFAIHVDADIVELI